MWWFKTVSILFAHSSIIWGRLGSMVLLQILMVSLMCLQSAGGLAECWVQVGFCVAQLLPISIDLRASLSLHVLPPATQLDFLLRLD